MVQNNSTFSASIIPYPDSKATLDLLAARGIYPGEINPRHPKDYYKFLCPLPGHAHDSDPSFWVHENGIQWKCFPCGAGGGPKDLIDLLGGRPASGMPKTPRSPKKSSKSGLEEPLQGCTLAQLAEGKGLPIEHLRSLGWYDAEYQYKLNGRWATCPAVAMPFLNAVQLRVGLTDKKNRFRWQFGSDTSAKELYGQEWLRSTDTLVLMVEGATDVAAALLMGVPAVGLPGTGTWTRKNGPRWAKELSGRTVVVWQEPDEAAQKLVDAMAQDIRDLRIIQAPPGIKDVVELLNQAGDGAGEYLRELINEARPYYEAPEVHDAPHVVTQPREKSALWAYAKENFPLPSGTKPWRVARVLCNDEEGKVVVCDYYSNSWRNPVNAQHKRRCLFFNILPRINGPQLYAMRIPVDDWSPQGHDAIKKRIGRAIRKAGNDDLGWLWFNNAMSRGHFLYLISAPDATGFEPVEDVEATLIDALSRDSPDQSDFPGHSSLWDAVNFKTAF